MMTAKHFIALADYIKSATPVSAWDGSEYTKGIHQGKLYQHEFMVEKLADFCASQNPRFKRQRWLDYIDGKCGPKGGEVK